MMIQKVNEHEKHDLYTVCMGCGREEGKGKWQNGKYWEIGMAKRSREWKRGIMYVPHATNSSLFGR